MKQLLVLSGKGGTGKTTVASAFITLEQAHYYADCDVDAPNLHLVMSTDGSKVTKPYFGLPKAFVEPLLCMGCGRCEAHCRFDAIHCLPKAIVEETKCEGCGVCEKICPHEAIHRVPSEDGTILTFETSEEKFVTANLKTGSGTTGKLVTAVKKQLIDATDTEEMAILDGSPGIGCPVIASISGVDWVLVVAEPSVSGISDMKRIVKTAKRLGVSVALCVNKDNLNRGLTEDIKGYCTTQDVRFVGQIPYDREVVRALNRGESIVKMPCAAGEAVKTVYQNMRQLIAAETPSYKWTIKED